MGNWGFGRSHGLLFWAYAFETLKLQQFIPHCHYQRDNRWSLIGLTNEFILLSLLPLHAISPLPIWLQSILLNDMPQAT